MASRRRARRPSDPWAAFASQTRFLLDCQAVIGLRLLRIAGGGEEAAREARRMVSEKMVACAEAQWDALAALPFSGIPGATAAAERRYRRAVAGNRRRLSR